MQKHLQRQVVSFGVTSMDPLGSLLFTRGEMGKQRQAGGHFCRASGAMVRSLNFEQWQVISEFKVVTGHDLILIFKRCFCEQSG